MTLTFANVYIACQLVFCSTTVTPFNSKAVGNTGTKVTLTSRLSLAEHLVVVCFHWQGSARACFHWQWLKNYTSAHRHKDEGAEYNEGREEECNYNSCRVLTSRSIWLVVRICVSLLILALLICVSIPWSTASHPLHLKTRWGLKIQDSRKQSWEI